MRYALVLVTHGDAPALGEAVKSLARHLDPLPSHLICVADGDSAHLPSVEPLGIWEIHQHRKQRGFGASVATGWDAAIAAGLDYVFWTENDFVLQRDVHVERMAFLLERDHRLAQVSLMRDGYSSDERRAGGLYEYRRADYEHHEEPGLWWMEHRAYFTTNPSLMRRVFMAENPWPTDGIPYPEGRYGLDLHERGYHYAVMGHGEVWVRHVGVRTGVGY